MAKVLAFKIPKTEGESFRVQVDRSPWFYDTLHSHPEIQITLILRGTGTLVCGDHIGNFSPGDLFIVGANQPHVLRSNQEYYAAGTGLESHAVSLFFEENSFGHGFFSLPESVKLMTLLNATQTGLWVEADTAEALAPQIATMPEKQGLERLMAMLGILKQLAESDALSPLATALHPRMDDREGERMNRIVQLAMREYQREIPLSEVAALANMTPNAFCRYFKQKTRKTFVAFLNEIRVAHACELLRDEEVPVAEVGLSSGFNNLSNFNRQFKRIKGCSPSVWRGRVG